MQYGPGMILQDRIPYDTGTPRRLPGVMPLDPADWILVDDAFAAQMAERERLISERPGDVLGWLPGSEAAQHELLAAVLDALPAGYAKSAQTVTRPDGVVIGISERPIMETLGRLVQCDLCLMEKAEGDQEHILTAAALCFPGHWTLAEKIGRPLGRIHKPVAAYDEDVARRVQRLFDGLQPGRPIWRWNRHANDDPTLFSPAPEALPRSKPDPGTAPYSRSERQCLVRLPQTRAVVFSIHTVVVRAGR